MSKEGRAILESTLGSLLGFEEGAGDVLDHLLTIESKEDLLEYLSQLLGDAIPQVLEFVENIGRYGRGETLMFANQQGIGNAKAAPSNNNKQTLVPLSTGQSDKKRQQQTSKKASIQARRNNQKQNKSRVPPPKLKSPPPANSAASTESNNHNNSEESDPTASTISHVEAEVEEAPRAIEKSRPSRGKAKTVCGCFGVKHKPLTNCLYCGRISCVEEGYDFCPFCGLLVEEIKDEIHDNDQAWTQKERLLRFDREFARRTEIFDDQADYQGPSTWMTAEERQQAEENQRKQLESLKRPKQTLNIGI